ncbi:MAG: hypothetical protein KAG96_05430, partial [Ichthyobacteriaceae bacterium]|nr:hypothetical protein [Ichthyobacteriaceae bacterium]
MKKTKQYLLIVVILLFGVSAKAQYSFYHEYGASLGTTLINGDWHKDSGAMSVLGFRGVKGGFIHGMQMVRERYSIKNSLDFSYISNVHGDKLPNDWVVNANKDLEDANGDPLPYKRDTDDEKKWADMSGTSMLVTLGSQIEYNFIDFGLYYPRNDWTPYVGAGFDVMYYHSSLSTTRGQFTPENIP